MTTTKIQERNFDSSMDMANQSTLEEVSNKVANVDTNITAVKTVADNIYAKVDTEINAIDERTAALVSRLNENRADALDRIGNVNDTGASTTAGSILGKLNKVISDISTFVGNWTSTRAGYVDNINSNVATNNTASKTGVLSAKLAYVISLLENTTYGLSAIKAALSSSGGSYALGPTLIKTITNNNESYTVTQVCFLVTASNNYVAYLNLNGKPCLVNSPILVAPGVTVTKAGYDISLYEAVKV